MNYHAVNLINKELLFAAQAPQGLKRCADAQRFFIRKNVVPEAQHSKRAYSQLFLTKRSQAFTT